MNLRRVANKFETTSFDIFNESTQLWETEGMDGKIMPIDRFLSIFHRATRRRALGLSPNATLPTSNTIRDASTGQAYVVGLVRADAAKDTAYDSTGILHGCDYIASILRKAPIGLASDPGVLVETTVGQHYMDIELRASAESPETTDEYDAHFFLTAPAQADIQQWDFVNYNGTSYHIQTVYNDSGLKMARVVEQADPRVDVTFHKRAATAAYAPATGVVTSGMVNYAISGFFRGFQLKDVNEESISSGDVQFIIEQDNIGVVPTNHDELTWESQTYKVKAVQQDFLKRQYKLHCVI